MHRTPAGLDPKRLPGNGLDRSDPLVPVTDNEQVTIVGILQGSKDTGEPGGVKILGFVNEDRIVLSEITGSFIQMFKESCTKTWISFNRACSGIPHPIYAIIPRPAIEMDGTNV